MTRDEVLARKPGRELDALVAEKVMGWKIRRETVLTYGSNPLATYRTLYTVTDGRGMDWSPTYDLDGVGLPQYSTDISAAWEVVEEMGDCLHLRQHGEQGEWEAWFCGYPNSKAHGETAPEAICKAALLAVMEE